MNQLLTWCMAGLLKHLVSVGEQNTPFIKPTDFCPSEEVYHTQVFCKYALDANVL